MLVKTARVCWTRGSEYGLHLVALHRVEAARVERFVRDDMKKTVCAQS